jgi:hypothetical protein
MNNTIDQTVVENLERKLQALAKKVDDIEKDIRMQGNPAFYRPGDVRDPKYRY